MRKDLLLGALAGVVLACAAGPASPAGLDPEAEWERFLSTAAFGDAYGAYSVLDDLGYGASVDPDACRVQAARLKESLAIVPVSVALHHAAMLCAEATGDDAAADRELAAVGALAGAALASGFESEDPRPIRIAHPVDAIALLRVADLETAYAYHRAYSPGRGMPYTIVGWNPELQVERHLTFDYVDTAATINRNDIYSGFPVDRVVIGRTFRDQFASLGEVAAVDAKALHDAILLPRGSKARVDAFRPAAVLGGTLATVSWIVSCTLFPFDGCSDGLVDAVLPHAEARHAMAMVHLAMLYESGLGVARDSGAAEALVDAADARWPEYAASVEFASTWRGAHPDEAYPEWLRQRLEAGEAAGSTDARVALARGRIAADAETVLDAADIAAFAAERSNGNGSGASDLADYYALRGDTKAKFEWNRKAAEYGNAAAQANVAYELLHGDAANRDEAEGLRLMRDAAQGGNAWAQRYMAYRAEDEGKWADARNWLLGSVLAYDVESVLELARLMEWERPGAGGTVAEAIESYRSVAEAGIDRHSAEARRRLASMAADGRGMDKDPKQAEAWLREDAEAGDMASAAMLGLGYLRGTIGGGDGNEAKGRALVAEAIAGGEQVHADFGYWLFYGKADPASKQEALEVWRRGVDKEELGSRNNLAWVLCTSPDPEVVDPEAGLVLADGMQQEGISAGTLDTVAACHAATGDFEGAVSMQQKALDMVLAVSDKDADSAPFRERLALYRAGKPYLETVVH